MPFPYPWGFDPEGGVKSWKRRLALRIITRFCPLILDKSVFFLDRIAAAEYVCRVLAEERVLDPSRCDNIKLSDLVFLVEKANEWAVKVLGVKKSYRG